MTKNKHLMSFKAVELRSLVHYRIYRNYMLCPQNLSYRTLRNVSAGRYIDISQTEHSLNLEVIIKLANCNQNFGTWPYSHQKKHIHGALKVQNIEF